MTITRITIEPGTASQAGRVDVTRVNATTETQIAQHMEVDEQDAVQEGCRPVRIPSAQAAGVDPGGFCPAHQCVSANNQQLGAGLAQPYGRSQRVTVHAGQDF